MSRMVIMAWVQASRLPFYVATFIPLLIGWTIAMKSTGMVRPWRFVLVFLGSLTVHLITNLANDYFDHLGGTDAGQAIGGSRVIQEGKITPKTMFRVIVSLYILAFAIAFIIIFGLKLYLLAIPIFFAAFSSYFYVAPPIRYGYHGLGELFVGVNMGPIMVVGTYWVITGHPGWTPFLISIPVGLMVALILYYQSLPDMETDAAVHKNTRAVKLGKKRLFRGPHHLLRFNLPEHHPSHRLRAAFLVQPHLFAQHPPCCKAHQYCRQNRRLGAPRSVREICPHGIFHLRVGDNRRHPLGGIVAEARLCPEEVFRVLFCRLRDRTILNVCHPHASWQH